MTATGPRTVGLLVEAPADAQTVRILVDRALQQAADWLTEELVEHQRAWRGLEPETSVSYWKDVRKLCNQYGVRGVKVHGRFGDESRAPDAYAARRALVLFEWLGMPDTVVLVRDADDQPERARGLTQARELSGHPDRVAIGVANPEREAWHIAGFCPCAPEEHAALRAERQRLGFDPTERSHQLRGEGKRSAKLALRALTHDDRDRERRCLTEPTLEMLSARGSGNGLADFLVEVRDRVVPRLL